MELINSTTLGTKQFVFPQIIRKPIHGRSLENAIILVDPLYTTEYPYEKGLPTYKLGLQTTTGTRTREYLPIKQNEALITYLNYIPGTTWIPVRPVGLEQPLIYTLQITNARQFSNVEFIIQWESNIQQDQLAIVQKMDITPPRQRIWNVAKGRSFLRYPPTNETNPKENTAIEVPVARQLFTITIPTWYIQENQALSTVLGRAENTLPNEPHYGNVYLRFRSTKLSHYYVLCRAPSHNGLTFKHGETTLYFHRIKPLTGPKYRFIYAKLSKFKGPTDWIPLQLDEIMFLSRIMPPKIHAKLIERLF